MQVLTLEDWEIVLTRLVAATNWGAALYLLAWILIGHFVVLTLFLAVILEAFESMYDVKTGNDLIIAEIEARKSAVVPHTDVSRATAASTVVSSSVDSAFIEDFVSRQRSGVCICHALASVTADCADDCMCCSVQSHGGLNQPPLRSLVIDRV